MFVDFSHSPYITSKRSFVQYRTKISSAHRTGSARCSLFSLISSIFEIVETMYEKYAENENFFRALSSRRELNEEKSRSADATRVEQHVEVHEVDVEAVIAFPSINPTPGTQLYICRQRANLKPFLGYCTVLVFVHVIPSRTPCVAGTRASSWNSRLFPELNSRRSAGGAFCLGARSNRDLVSNNAMPAPPLPTLPPLIRRQRPPCSFIRQFLSHDDDVRFSKFLLC